MSVLNSTRHQTLFSIWLFVSLTVMILPVNAQKYFFDNYSVKQGLKRQKVYTILQDSKDYFWFGTSNGVTRFDGKKFENFSLRDGIAFYGVKCIIEDSLGFIWFGHLNGGISRFDGQKFEQAAFDSLIITGDITHIAQIKNKLWFTSAIDGAIMTDFPIKDIKHIKAKQFRGKEGLSDQVFGASVTHEGAFICIADVGLRKYNSEEKKFEKYQMPHMKADLPVTCMLEDKEGNMWLGTYNGGINEYIKSQSRMKVIDLVKAGVASNWITCLLEDSKGRIWVGTWEGGIAVIEGENVHKYNSGNGLKAIRIYDIIEDVEGNILIADQNNGITIYKGDAFETINDKEILPHPNVNAIYQEKSGAVWFGTNAGISRYYPGSDKKPIIFNHTNNLTNEDVRFFREDKDGNLWIGANEQGVIMYNMKTSRFEAQPYINSILYRGGQVKALEIDKQNNLWIGTVEGIAMGTIGEQNFQRYTLFDSLTVSLITALYCDPNGDMWIGNEPRGNRHGLIKYDASKKDFKTVLALPPGLIPTTMVMDGKGVLWTGTADGLIAIRNDSILSTLTQNEGLLSNSINLLALGDDGRIYIGTTNGLNIYFPDNKRIFSYTERNGFTGVETMPNAVYKSPEGNLWFGTSNGVTRLRPDKLITGGSEPMTHIMDMQVNYNPHEMTPGMKLKYNESSVLFDYYSICLTNPDVVRFKVKLEGAEKNWRPVTDQTRAIYSSLSPGKYTFNVIASNSQGIWNSKPVTFPFIIKPPFYLTWWFLLISVSILVVIVAILIRTQNLVRDKKILEIKVKERTAEIEQQKIEIEAKRDLVTKQKEHIEDIHKGVTDSINYAKRLQTSALPNLKLLDDYFCDLFLLFKPKDVVSGDFYWFAKVEDRIVVTVADCTGHGVPGAFMSMLGMSLLKEIIVNEYITQPDVILKRLRKEIIKALGQTGEYGEQKDGMDISLCSINTESLELQWSGANNPCLIIRSGELIELKADKMPIAIYDKMDKFALHEMNLQKGDNIYLSSDGYADQFGGPDNKKFMSLRFKELLLTISTKPMNEQKDILDKTLEEWRIGLEAENEQTDDITVMGIKIS